MMALFESEKPMIRRFVPLVMLLACATLSAQERPTALSVGYPSTTIAYIEGDVAQLTKTLSDPALLKGLGMNLEIPDFGKEISERLEIELTDAEVRKLVGGIQRASWGLLDIGVGRPRLKMQIVLRHEDPSLLSNALARAKERGSSSVLDVQEYEGVKVYEVELPAREVEVDPEVWAPANPMDDFLAFDALYIAVYDNKFIVASTGLNHVKDAIDFLSFPDDATDTLAGNKRFKDALVEFDNPTVLGFINTTALINTVERVSGDKGNSPINEFFGGVIRFTGELLEYKQLKSIAAGLWIDEATGTLRADARVQFHNEPAIYSAIKLKPVPQPLAEFVPVDTVYGMTYGIEKPRELYTRVMELLRSRAKESGQQDVLRQLDRFEEQASGQGVKVEEILDQLANAQALLVLPPGQSDKPSRRYRSVQVVGLFRLRNVKEAEDFLYEKLMRTKLGEPLRKADLDITMFDDVEIHHPPAADDEDPMAYAFVNDVFILGNLQGIKRVVEARKSGATLSTMDVYKQARGMIWEKCGSTTYLNVGAMIELSGGGMMRYYSEREQPATVDATNEDANSTPYLAKFFRNTVLVWGTQARENELAVRLCVAGWPSMDRFKELAGHFRDVARNKQVRNDFIQILNGATTHFAIKGEAARSVEEIKKGGYLPKAKEFIDPFSEDGEKRSYIFAEVPKDLDIRQPVLLAYQAKPGLGGKHLAVLWNGYIVKFSPRDLERALARAKEGKSVENYPLLRPLVAARPRNVKEEPRVKMMEVEIIDDDGTERAVAAVEGDALDAERRIDTPVEDVPDEHNEDPDDE